MKTFLFLLSLISLSARATGIIPFHFIPLQTDETCPSNYIPIYDGGNVNFCVMKFEAKDVGGVPTSQPALVPWGNISAINSKAACRALGLGYDLISNYEWMIVAYHIEKNPLNWTGGAVGSGKLYIGHTDNSPSSAQEVTNESDPYNLTGNTIGSQQRRTFHIDNYVIWDFAGNVNEWVDWGTAATYTTAPLTCPAGGVWKDYKDVSCTDYPPNTIYPWNPAGIPLTSYDSATYNLGQFWGGSGSGGGMRRGGHFNETPPRGGIYYTNVGSPPDDSSIASSRGFRCVYRKKP